MALRLILNLLPRSPSRSFPPLIGGGGNFGKVGCLKNTENGERGNFREAHSRPNALLLQKAQGP